MILETKETGGVAYARKEAYVWEDKNYEADIKNGDIVTIKDAGRTEEGQYGPQKKFLIETRNGEKRATFNQSTINVLVTELGNDTENWVGKKVKVLTKKDVIGGKKVIVAYFVTEGWSLDDYGELEKDGGVEGVEKSSNNTQGSVESAEEGFNNINPDDIPF